MPVIECRGLACPQPVITTKKALDQQKEGEMIIIVDNASSCNNVERFAQSRGCSVKVENKGQDFYVHIQKVSETKEAIVAKQEEKVKKVVVYSIPTCWVLEMKHWLHF